MFLHLELLKRIKPLRGSLSLTIFGIVVLSAVIAYTLMNGQRYLSKDFSLDNFSNISDISKKTKDEVSLKKHTEYNKMRFNIL